MNYFRFNQNWNLTSNFTISRQKDIIKSKLKCHVQNTAATNLETTVDGNSVKLKVKQKALSRGWLCNPMDNKQSMEFYRSEYWSG